MTTKTSLLFAAAPLSVAVGQTMLHYGLPDPVVGLTFGVGIGLGILGLIRHKQCGPKAR